AYIVGVVGHPYLTTWLPLWLTMPSYTSTTPAVLAVGFYIIFFALFSICRLIYVLTLTTEHITEKKATLVKYVGGYMYSLYRHTLFDVFYNDDRVVEIIANANPFELVDLTQNNDIEVEFTYSVKWNETSTSF
ncbi:hypothetical protein BHM03_00062102, partial [Ensete ventricosum]